MQEGGVVNELDSLRQQMLLAGCQRKMLADSLDELGAKAFARRKQIIVQRIELRQIFGKIITIEDFQIFHGVGLSTEFLLAELTPLVNGVVSGP
jgi:hypothetical protein